MFQPFRPIVKFSLFPYLTGKLAYSQRWLAVVS
jgi:hypothetical protein